MSVCDNFGGTRPRWIVEQPLLPVLERVGPIITWVLLPFDFICRRRGCRGGGLRSFTRSLTLSPLRTGPHGPTQAHLALRERERVLSPFNPRLSWGAHSIWWVSEPRVVHLLHSPLPTYVAFPPFFLITDTSIHFFFASIRERTYGCGGHDVTDRQHDMALTAREEQGRWSALVFICTL